MNLLVLFQRIKSQFTKEEIGLIIAAFFFTFCICADYSVVRPIANALYITSYGSTFLPWAWLCSLPLNFFIVNWYSKKISTYHPFRLYVIFAAVIISVNVLSAFFADRVHALPFILYVWKDIYILLMFQQLWSILHSKIKSEHSKFLYGIMFGMGGLGSLFGSCIPGFFAVQFGSERLLLCSLVFYLCASLAFWHFLRISSAVQVTSTLASKPILKDSLKTIRSSRILTFIAAAVILLQTSSAIADYLFHAGVQAHIPTKDLRAQYVAQIFGFVSFACIIFQFFGAYLFTKYAGIVRSHRAMPLVLLLVSALEIIHPSFGLFSIHFFLFKTFDFSLFTILKEMLYVKLPSDQKFRAKSFIDVFAHRSSKAIASCLILVLEACSLSNLNQWLCWALVILTATWFLAAKKWLQEDRAAETLPITD